MTDRKGILLKTDFDLGIVAERDAQGLIISGLVIGLSIDQEVAVALKTNQGDLKEDPLFGINLTRLIRGKGNSTSIETAIKKHLLRIGIDYNEYKENIKIKTGV